MTNTPFAPARSQTDDQLLDSLRSIENTLYIETFGNDYEARDEYEAQKMAVFGEMQRRGLIQQKKEAPKRPRCETKLCANKATKMLMWDLSGGRQVRFACKDHLHQHPVPYYVSTLEGVEQ